MSPTLLKNIHFAPVILRPDSASGLLPLKTVSDDNINDTIFFIEAPKLLQQDFSGLVGQVRHPTCKALEKEQIIAVLEGNPDEIVQQAKAAYQPIADDPMARRGTGAAAPIFNMLAYPALCLLTNLNNDATDNAGAKKEIVDCLDRLSPRWKEVAEAENTQFLIYPGLQFKSHHAAFATLNGSSVFIDKNLIPSKLDKTTSYGAEKRKDEEKRLRRILTEEMVHVADSRTSFSAQKSVREQMANVKFHTFFDILYHEQIVPSNGNDIYAYVMRPEELLAHAVLLKEKMGDHLKELAAHKGCLAGWTYLIRRPPAHVNEEAIDQAFKDKVGDTLADIVKQFESVLVERYGEQALSTQRK